MSDMIEMDGVGKSIIDVIEEQVRLNPHKEALLLENGTSYSYGVLDAIATGLARHVAHSISQLGELDMGENNTPLVTVIMNRGVGIAAAFVAILKAGCAYVPVDPTFPPNRQSYIMKQSRSHLLIIDPENMMLAQSLGVTMPPALVVDGSTGELSSKHASAFPLSAELCPTVDAKLLAYRAEARNRPQGGLAYILFTSGSTGNPKGCVAHNQSCLSQLQAFGSMLSVKAPIPGSNRSHRTLGLATYSFDISVLELFMPLVHGTTVVLAFSSSQRDAFRLKEIIDTMNVDVMQATPTTYEMLLAVGWKGRSDIQLLVGGEAFRPSLLPLVHNCRSIRNIYGPTETTIWSSTYLVPKDIVTWNPTMRGISCGEPLPGVKFYLASREDYKQLIKDDEGEGELIIGGVGANSGRYIHAPELTAAVFHPNPYGDPGKIYQSGDIFRRKKVQRKNEDGSVINTFTYIFASRNDDQVKIDGFRIELEEIERVFLHSAPNKCVDVCVAIVRNKKLILYIKPKPAERAAPDAPLEMSKSEIEAMKSEAAKSLMYYMMPLHYVVVQKFATTPSFKIDRKQLPDPVEWAELAAQTEAMAKAENCRAANSLPIGVEVVRSRSGYWDPAAPTKDDEGTETEEENLLGKPITMLQHVTSVIFKARGVRPAPTSNFASIGVDSLGAIFFLTVLSESLGGLRIKPQEMFSQGITIESFSRHLLQRLDKEHPERLQTLNIAGIAAPGEHASSTPVIGVSAGASSEEIDVDRAEKGCARIISCSKVAIRNLRQEIMGSDDEHAVNEREKTAFLSDDAQSHMQSQLSLEEEIKLKERDRVAPAWAFEADFEAEYSDVSASNVPMLDGLRCIFTLIVLFDHFWSGTSWELKNGALGSSISMFLIVTGWGTALALHESEKLDFHTVTNWFKKDSSSAAQERVIGYMPKRRTPFNWKTFLLTRFIGLFPILWLAMVLAIPWWIDADNKRIEFTHHYYSLPPADRPKVNSMDLVRPGSRQSPNGAICTTLYVIGLQSFYRPTCGGANGPNVLLFGSIIWGLFLIWIIPKIVWNKILEKAMRWRLNNGNARAAEVLNISDEASEFDSAASPVIKDSAKTGLVIHKNMPAEYTEIDSLFDTTGDSLHRHKIGSASVTQTRHEYLRALFFRITYNRPNGFGEMVWFTAVAGIIAFLILAFRGPWQMKNSVIFLPDFLAGLMGAAICESYCYARFVARKRDKYSSALHAWFGLQPNKLMHQALSKVRSFFPDLSWALFFFIISDATETLRRATEGFGRGGSDTWYFIDYVWVELLVLLLLFSYFTQEKECMSCISRYVLSTRICTAIGHSSYATYLLQRIAMDVWAPTICFFFETGKWRWNYGANYWGGSWFEDQRHIYKILGLVCLLFFTWLVQVYFQDYLVARAFVNLRSKWNQYWEHRAYLVNGVVSDSTISSPIKSAQATSIELANI